MPADTLRDLARSFLDLWWHFDPVEASCQGFAEHDRRLGSFTDDGVRQQLAALTSLMGAVEAAEVASLEDEIDRTALLNHIRFFVHRLKEEQPHVRNPAFWVSHLLEGLYILLVLRDRAPDALAAAFAERLGQTPRFLREARETLAGPPRILIDVALRQATAGRQLIRQGAAVRAPASDPTFPDLVTSALGALDEFIAHLDGARDGALEDGFAIGEDAFNFRVHHQHALNTTASELARFGERLTATVERDLESVAAEIAPGMPWPDLLDRLRADHPDRGELVPAYARAMRRAQAFVVERGLTSLPDGTLEVVPTPAYLRPLVPFAAYQPPGACSDDRHGLFYVTPPDEDGTADQVHRALRDHCLHEIPTIALHEGYPGHHVQFLTAHQSPGVLRRLLTTPVTVEGWALYCEEMMAEEGFFVSAEERFFQRVALLWRALRVTVDVGLHTRGMSFDEAVALLSDRVHFERETIEAEVRRYCAHPSYQMAYAVGLHEIRTLRDDYRAARGADFRLRDFHDALLAYGGYPVALARWGMGL